MSNKAKRGFTREQHSALGQKLADMEDVLHHAIIAASHAYPVTGPEIKALERVSRALDHARSVMDDWMMPSAANGR